MSDLETQIRTYARWLTDTADTAAHDAVPAPARAAPSPWRRRAVMLAAVAAGVLLVIALGSIVRAPSDAPPADVPATSTTTATAATTSTSSPPQVAADRVTLADGYTVAVVGEPVEVNGVEVWQGAPVIPLAAEAEADLIGSAGPTAVLFEPIALSDVMLSDDLVRSGPDVVAAAGSIDGFAVLAHATSYAGAAPDVRCVVITSTVDESAWHSVCGGGDANGAVIGSQGASLGSWIVWTGLPDAAALVVLRGADGAALFQYPVARTAAFPARLIAGANQFVAYGPDGETLAIVDTPNGPTPTSGTTPATTTPASETDEFVVASAFGDVAAGALAVTTDGRVVAAAGPELLVRDRRGTIVPMELPPGIEVSQAWVGANDIAVAWGPDQGVEVELDTGDIVTRLTRTGETWSRVGAVPDGYVEQLGEPRLPLGTDRPPILVGGTAPLPVVEHAGCFEVIGFELGQSWTLGRPAECSAHVAELAALVGGGYLAVLRTMDVVLTDQPGTFAEYYPYILHPDGTIETLPPIDGTDGTSEVRVDVQPGPHGLTVLTIDGATATIEHVPVP